MPNIENNNYTKNYKNTYSKEIELLDNLVKKIEEAANNLDIDTMEHLLRDFELNNYSSLRPSNQQSFDILKVNIYQTILEIRRKKELASKRQKDLQDKEDAYKKLQQIKKNVLNAKTVSDLEKAKKQYERWKNDVNTGNKIKFGWDYNSKVDALKDLIREEIGPEEAISELKYIIDRAKHSDGFENDNDIKSWMSKYPLDCFHEVYKKEVKNLTNEAFSLVKPTTINDENSTTIVGIAPSVLLMNPTQSSAVHDLQRIMDRNSKDFASVLQWIYTYRNITFNGPYKQAISTLIPAEYGLNLNAQYSIPFFEKSNLSSKKIKSLVKDTVINYFGILLCGNDLSSVKKHMISDTYKTSQETNIVSEISNNEEITDKILEAKENDIISITNSEATNTLEIQVNEPLDSDDEKVANKILKIKENDISSVTTSEATKSTEIQIKGLLISDDEKNLTEEKDKIISIEENISETITEVQPIESASSNDIIFKPKNNLLEDNNSEISDVLPNKKNNTPKEIEVEVSSILPEIEVEEQNLKNSVLKSEFELSEDEKMNFISDVANVTISSIQEPIDNVKEPSPLVPVDPYSLTNDDIQNIENIYTFVQPKLEKVSISPPKIKDEPFIYTENTGSKSIDLDNQN